MNTKAFFPCDRGIGRENQIFLLRTTVTVKFFSQNYQKITFWCKKVITHSDAFQNLLTYYHPLWPVISQIFKLLNVISAQFVDCNMCIVIYCHIATNKLGQNYNKLGQNKFGKKCCIMPPLQSNGGGHCFFFKIKCEYLQCKDE